MMKTQNEKKFEVITLSDNEDGDSGISINVTKPELDIMFKKMKRLYKKMKKIKKHSFEAQKKIISPKSNCDKTAKNVNGNKTDNQEKRNAGLCQKYVDETKSNYWMLGDDKYVSVRNFKGNLFVDLREFFIDEWIEEMVPSKNGIYLNLKIWNALFRVIGKINDCINRCMSPFIDYPRSISLHKNLEILQEYLGDDRYVTVYQLKDKFYVDVRQFYFDGATGEIVYCRNGLDLSYENWKAFYKVHKQVHVCLNDKWEKICHDYLQNKWCL